MNTKLLGGFLLGVGALMLVLTIMRTNADSKIDYRIEIDELHGVIINGDTLDSVKHIEEYIYVDNI